MAIDLGAILAAASAAICVIMCLHASTIASRLGVMDQPNERKLHTEATPLLGGVALLVAFAPAALIWIVLEASDRWLPTLLIWLSAVISVAAVGVADDRHSLTPRIRLLLTFAIFGAAAIVDPSFNVRLLDFLYAGWSLGLGTWWLAVIFTVICLVGLLNAVNMADGKNGLVLGLCLGWLVILGVRAPVVLVPLIALLFATCVVLFVFNMRGKLFLGDGGAYGLASAVGLLAIIIYNTPGVDRLRAISAEELVVLFLVPVFDSFRLTYTRMRAGKSPMAPDRNHLHHLLQDRFGWPRGLAIYLVLACLPWFTLILLF